MRTLWAALLAAAALALVLGGWFATGWRSAGAEAAALIAAPEAEATRRAGQLAGELAARLEELRAAENQRPYYEYQNLYHDPRGASLGRSVAPSPLARGPSDELVAVHFQIAADGSVTVPTINEAVPELSDPARSAADRPMLAALRARAGKLIAGQAGARPQAGPPEQVQELDPSAYAQNVTPNQVYLEVQQQQRGAGPSDAPPPPKSGAIEVRTAPLTWRTDELSGAQRLLAMRSIATPDGTLTQGFTLAPQALATWLQRRAGDLPVALVAAEPDEPARPGSAPLPLGDARWRVQVDPGPALAAARVAAGELLSDFLWRFTPAACLAIACAVLLIALVRRAERLARERSDFAAAAAHELRTPLAGLVLYGDMLADGLGNQARSADYARRVSDEAQRLGRVVGNVLGFTQLERRGLAVSARPADLAQAARDAAERMRPALAHADVELVVTLPDSASARFDADAVARILQNLLDNAEKYSRGVADRSIELTLRSQAGRHAVDVADRGSGVPAALRDRLFRPFARSGGEGGPAGLGLGLALARAQARAMGGDLTYRDRDGGGAIFTLSLPAA